jgi:hypothetical protein
MTSGIKKQNPLIQTTEIQQSLTTDCILFQIKKKKKPNLQSDPEPEQNQMISK